MLKTLKKLLRQIFNTDSYAITNKNDENYDTTTNIYYVTQEQINILGHLGKNYHTAIEEAKSEGRLPSDVKIIEVPYWNWDDYWARKKKYHGQWDYFTIFIPVNENLITHEIDILRKKKNHIRINPRLHITIHYTFTIKEGYSQDDLLGVLQNFFSKYNSPEFSINEVLWLHKNPDNYKNIIAFGIDQSNKNAFEEIRIGLTNTLSQYIFALKDFEKNPEYKTKARPHISIAYGLDYHAAELLHNELKKQQLNINNKTVFRTFPITQITMIKSSGKRKTYFDFDFKGKCWKK